jgi:hypothetical protein
MIPLIPQQELDKIASKAHEEWLKHPVTQDILKILETRRLFHIKNLQDGILLASNKELEDKLRTAITTTAANIILISDTKQFVEHLNKLNK